MGLDARDTVGVMSSDAKAIIGTVVGCALALGLLVTALIGARIDDLGARIDRMETRLNEGFERFDERLRAVDERLRAVEVGFGKIDQRLATLERLHLPTPPAEN